MNDYDFKTLNDKEFEVLATDLLSKRDGVKYERFKPGRDGGVDGRYFSPLGEKTILQCKHWISTPIEKLIKNLAEKELLKVKRLNPDRYILVLSNPLSANDKDNIFKKLSPYLKSPSDILGREDLNDLLSLNEDIERKHYKLWIASSNVLNSLLNKAILDRSDYLLKEIISNAHIYVETENHALALEKLDKLGTVIITGPAGIGKTTLAEQLLLHYTALGYSLYYISEEIKEAESVFESEDEQIFFFDDFLGRNYLEALSGHEGTHIVNFIKRIKKSKNKKFILTSRTTILNQGKSLNDVFENNNIQRNEFEISFDSFTDLDKAKILYNHIWHSTLSKDFVDQIYISRRYREIIKHANYNPRIIKFITDSERLSGCDVANYWEYSKSLLDNPAEVWSNSFEAQHDDFGRALILLVTLNARPILQSDLAEVFSRFLHLPYASSMQGKKDYLQQLRHLVGSMLNRLITPKKFTYINLFNPSIADYVLRRYALDNPALRAAFSCLRSISSLNTIVDMEKNKIISKEAKNILLDEIISKAMSSDYEGYSDAYIGTLIFRRYENIKDPSIREIVESASSFTMRSIEYPKLTDSLKLAAWRFKEGISSERDISDYLSKYMNASIDFEEAQIISDLIARISDSLKQQVLEKLEHSVSEYLSDEAESEFSDDDVFYETTPSDFDAAPSNLRKLIKDKFRSINIDPLDSSVEEIISSYDFSGRAIDYFALEDESFYDKERHSRFNSLNKIDEIDDLFERD
ncbi:restriction endonuclease [Comamonas thiooxydans]|uniref:nSTAND3 domain-containing NTPase n=1 Tax=Comamonas thiooxydans TaxID=363952 RepID=UPI0009B85F77|nr:restriction endonuclease [Comamonas thiooxydans]